MADVQTKKRGRGRPPKDKKEETKKKVNEMFKGIPLKKNEEGKKEAPKKPQPKDNELDFVLEQLDAANLKIKELEDQVIHYKSSYEKLSSQGGGNDGAIAQSVQQFFNDLVKRDQSRAQFGGAVVKLNYTGPVAPGNAGGLLQEMLKRFPFIKG